MKIKFAFNYKTVILFLAAMIPLLYSLYTNHIWEDYFITFKFSKNLCEGNGMVYHIGEKVHGFTSPLGTLLPAFCYYISGMKSYEAALWLFRILFCIPCFVLGAYFVMRTMEKLFKDSHIPALFVGLMYVLECKAVMYSVNGMETGIMLFFMAWTIYLTYDNIARNYIHIGVAWAGLMWTRPDSCIYIAVIMTVHFIFGTSPRRAIVVSSLKAGLITTVLYLPWFLWAWYYYGSPVPHTIVAKGLFLNENAIPRMISNFIPAILKVFAPVGNISFSSEETYWPVVLPVFCYASTFLSLIYWLIPGFKDKSGKAFSLTFFVLCIYFSYMRHTYLWYYPPLDLFAILAIVSFCMHLSRKLPWNIGTEKICTYFLGGFCVILLILLVFTSIQMRIHEREIEMGMRKQIGEWLKENSKPKDSVYLECLGYIGYFSDLKMFDWPGLVSPEVVKLLSENYSAPEHIAKLRPTWMVLRPWEAAKMEMNSYVAENYILVRTYDASEKLKAINFIPGRDYLNYDACFFIYRKKQKTSGTD